MIRFSFPVGTANLEIEAEDARDLVGQFEQIGGDGGALIKEVKAAAADPFELAVLATVPQQTEATTASDVSDPWAEDVSSSPTARPSDNDPWADDEEKDVSAGMASAANSGVSKTRDDFGRLWTMGLPEAPSCECGLPAARMDAKARGTGKPYSKWQCSKAAGKDWQDKCDYSEFVNKKK